MIAKAKSNKSLRATLDYNIKEKAELVYTNKLVGQSLADYRIQMEDLQKCYRGYGKQLTIHAILSPAIEDGKRLSNAQWQKISKTYLQQLGMQELQAIGFLHKDKEHRHLHLVINKVKETDFKIVHDGFIGKKSHKIADEIAVEMKLVRALEIKQARIEDPRRKVSQNQNSTKETPLTIGSKQCFKAILEEILQKPIESPEQYFEEIENAGFIVHRYYNKETGELRGYGIEKNGTKMDASAIGKEFTLKAIQIGRRNVIGNRMENLINQKEENKQAFKNVNKARIRL